MSEKQKNVNVYDQYLPLVKKIVHQFLIRIPKSCLSGEEIKDMEGAAWEGLSLGLVRYEESNKSSTSLITFLSYQIRFSILNYIQNESRTVRISSYKQGKMRQHGESGFKKNVSLDLNEGFFLENNNSNGEEEALPVNGGNINNIGSSIFGDSTYNMESYEDYAGSIDDILYQQIVKVISPESEVQYRNINILCEDFGICGFEKLDRKVISKKYGISDANICLIIKRQIQKMRDNDNFKQYLRSTFLS